MCIRDRLGIQYPEKTNKARFRSQLIYQATVEEDREKVWNNKESWKVVGVLNGIDLIDKVLPAGKKNEVIDVIDRISGYAESVEEVIKN